MYVAVCILWRGFGLAAAIVLLCACGFRPHAWVWVDQRASTNFGVPRTLLRPVFTGLDKIAELQALCYPPPPTVHCFVLPPSDLVGMYAHENVVNLTRYALPLEEFVRQEEERSARLAATLLPQYQANGEPVP